MRDAVAATTAAAVALPLAVASAVAVRCNVRGFREARAAAPLRDFDLGGATVARTEAPSSWPTIDDVDDPRVAAAYAALADDRAVSCAMGGEIVAVIGGAGVGTAIPHLYHPVTGALIVLAPTLLTMVGVTLSLRAARVWEPVAARYRERHAVLTAEPLPAPPPRRRGPITAWLRRRSRS